MESPAFRTGSKKIAATVWGPSNLIHLGCPVSSPLHEGLDVGYGAARACVDTPEAAERHRLERRFEKW